MIQVKGLPPNYEDILRVFPRAAGANVMFAFGDKVYVPSGIPLTPELLVHEEIHGFRQTESASGIDQWWRRYLEDPVFRRDEELVAHIAEYRSFCERHSDRNDRNGYLAQIAARFSGSLYNLGLGPREAAKLIVDKYR